MTLLADGSKLTPSVQKEAAKAGDEGAKTLGQKLSGGLKTEGVRIFGAVASAAFGLATKGALELENATARFRAETGASADEAAAAGKVINKVAGDERLSLEAVTDIAIKVRRDLGAIGDEADDLTADIARFARVTRQDGAGAVSDIDDLVDAWALSLKDVRPLLDKLVVSGQKWGGSIEADQKALAAMAPQLKAFNLGIDDGIALLDLFKASGLDAATIPRALNSAIQKLDGRPLQDFIKELAGIEDPGERAQRAIEVFGARAGAQLANAIKPGMDSLEDFKITTEESIGAVDKAADDLDSTISGKIQKFFSQVGAGVRGFGSDFGTAATAIASLGSLLATLGGGKLLKGLANVTLRPLAGLGIRIATFVGAEMAGSAAVSSLGSNFAAGLGKIPGVSSVKAAISKTGAALGTPLGKAIGITTAIVFVTWFVDELNKQRDEVAGQAKSIGDAVGDQIEHGTTAQLEQTAAALKTGMDAIVAETKTGFLQMANPQQLDALRALVEQYNAVQTELNKRAALSAAVAETEMRNAVPGAAQAAQDLADELPTALEKNAARTAGAAAAWARKPIGEQLVLIGHDARQRGAEAALALASGLRSARANIGSALDQLREDMKSRLTPKAEVGLRIGQLFSKTLAKGLKDSDPVIKAQAEGTRALIEDQLIETIKAGGEAGKKIQEELERKLKSKDPDVRRQAERTKSVIDAALKDQPPKTPGEKIAQDLARDVANGEGPVGRAAYRLGTSIARNLLRGVAGTGASVPSVTGSGGVTYSSGKINAIGNYDEGSWRIRGDQLALIHDREIVVPAAEADAIRAGTASIGAMQPAVATAAPPITFVTPPAKDRNAMLEALETARRYRDFGLFDRPAVRTPADG